MTIAATPGRRKAMALALGALAGCTLPPPPPCGAAHDGPVAWAIDHGWHTDIALRAEDLAGPLAGFRAIFPGAAALVFGFGKRSFVLAEAGSVEELLLGPIPGPGVMQVKGLALLPPAVYPGRTMALPIPQAGLARLSAFLWDSFALDGAGRPVPAHPGPLHGSLFFEAARGYSLAYTCNTWTAEGLRLAGLPVSETGVVLARGVLAPLARIGCAA